MCVCSIAGNLSVTEYCDELGLLRWSEVNSQKVGEVQREAGGLALGELRLDL